VGVLSWGDVLRGWVYDGKREKIGGEQPNVHDTALDNFTPAMVDNRLAGFDPFLDVAGRQCHKIRDWGGE
jgi:hypothetical protein